MRLNKRKVCYILLILLIISVGWLYRCTILGIDIPWKSLSNTNNFREIDIPGKWINTYLDMAKKYKISWEYLAAIDEVKSNYDKVSLKNIEINAKNLAQILGNNKETAELIEEILLKKYTKTEVSKILTIAKSYQWEAAPIGQKYSFPFLKQDRNKVSYSNSWGNPRTYGGKRKHEGIDLMAPKNIPLVAVTDGTIMMKRWNRLGGWSLFIQDKKYPHIFYYYAHLSKYQNNINTGATVKKGEVIGFVGNSGYGPEGTTGKFPPHLHFGVYIFLNFKLNAVNPFSFLKAWDRRDQIS